MYTSISMYTPTSISSIYKEVHVRCIHESTHGGHRTSNNPIDLLSGRDSVYSTEKAFNILETPVKTCLICMGTPIKSDVLREWPRPPTEEIRLQIIGSRDLSVFLIDLLCDDRSRDPMCVCVCARACVRERCIFVSRDLSVFPIDLLSPDRSFECR